MGATWVMQEMESMSKVLSNALRVSLRSTLHRQDIVFIDEFREKRTKQWLQSQCFTGSNCREWRNEPVNPHFLLSHQPALVRRCKACFDSRKDNYSSMVQAKIVFPQEHVHAKQIQISANAEVKLWNSRNGAFFSAHVVVSMVISKVVLLAVVPQPLETKHRIWCDFSRLETT